MIGNKRQLPGELGRFIACTLKRLCSTQTLGSAFYLTNETGVASDLWATFTRGLCGSVPFGTVPN